jgi:hypothetical protein
MSHPKLALALCSLLASCMSITDANRAIVVNLSVDRSVVSPATPAAVTVTMVNYGAKTIEVAHPNSYGCVPPFEVADASGRAVQLPGRLCAMPAFVPVKLAPGDSLTIRSRWSADQADSAYQPVPVPPGAYRLSARVSSEHGFITSPPVSLLVPSPQ